MRKLVLFTMVFAALFSCKIESSKKKIGFMIPTFTVERYKKDRDIFTSRVVELGGDVEIANAENDDKAQYQQAEELIAKGVDALVVIAVNQNTAAAIVRLAHEKNVEVIAYERLISNCELDYYIGFDHFIAGQQMAEYVAKNKPGGKCFVIGGDISDNNAVLINKGELSVIQSDKSGGVSVLHSIYIEDWDNEEAYLKMDEFLNLSMLVPDAVLVSNDGMASGVIKSLEKHGLTGSVIVSGLDADLSACQRIVKGTQSFTIYKPFKKEAIIAAEIAMLCANHKEVVGVTSTVNNKRIDVPSILIKTTLVDASNMKSTIIADGFYKETEVY